MKDCFRQVRSDSRSCRPATVGSERERFDGRRSQFDSRTMRALDRRFLHPSEREWTGSRETIVLRAARLRSTCLRTR